MKETQTDSNITCSNNKSQIVLLGCGPSTSVPWLRCLTDSNITASGGCEVCSEANKNLTSKNRRRNPSLLIKYNSPKNDKCINIVIDCGKTFRESAENFFPIYNVNKVDAVILTHDHADAVMGLDDLRDVQGTEIVYDPEKNCTNIVCPNSIMIWCCKKTMSRCYNIFPYLFGSPPGPCVNEGPALLLKYMSDISKYSYHNCKMRNKLKQLGLSEDHINKTLDKNHKEEEESSLVQKTRSFTYNNSHINNQSKITNSLRKSSFSFYFRQKTSVNKQLGDLEEDCGDALIDLPTITPADNHFSRIRSAPNLATEPLNSSNSATSKPEVPKMYVGSVKWETFKDFEAFEISGLKITPLPVLHGEDYICRAFEFGTKDRIIYMSDVSYILPITGNYLIQGPRIDILIIDSLFWDKTHPTHFNKNEALEAIKRLNPRRTILTGMCHNFDYYYHNEIIGSQIEQQVEMGYDGLCIYVSI